MDAVLSANKTLKNNNHNAFRKAIYLFFKRTLDITVSIICMPIALIIILVFGILIKTDSRGPILYRQERVGKNGKTFTIYKLRSMYIESEKNGPQWAQENDIRVTKIGKIIRKTRIDEIPQIINILKGEMSIVGPRPERPYFIYKFIVENPDFIDRLKVKPGLTGYAQVNGGYELNAKEKLEKDLYYIKHQSLWLDFKIILKTIIVIVWRIDSR